MGKSKLVERVVTYPKGLWAHDSDGKHQLYAEGETVMLSPKAAKAHAKHIEHPEVIAAKAKAEQAVHDIEVKEQAEVRKAHEESQDKKLKAQAKPEKAAKANKKDGGGS